MAGAVDTNWNGDGHLREIVQIGAFRVGQHDLVVEVTFERLVRP